VRVGDTVLVLIEIAIELVDFLQRLAIEHLAAIGHVRVVPLQIATHPIVHADVEVEQHQHRRL
jgi:hypothetical protein